jgi:hypothetical protein
MLRTVLAAIFLASASLTVATAQEACAPEKLASAIDAYASEPFGARAWRKMNGLGDPGIEPGSIYDDSWQQREEWKKLVQQVAPEQDEAANPAYDCRIGYPLSVLKQHIASFGAADPYVKQWVNTQAAVIKACGAGKGAQIALPDAQGVKAEQTSLLQSDRAYQAASIAIYTDKPKAIELFRAIAANNSPHKAAARYNIANLLANVRNIADARKEVQAILADPSLASVHSITEELDGYISNIEDTPAGWTALIDRTVATLSSPESAITTSEDAKKRYSSALYDISYVGVGAKQGDWWITNTMPEDPTISKALADAARKHPMALWMMTGQTVDQHFNQAPWSLVGPKWQAWNASVIDRALALEPAGGSLTGLSKDSLMALKASGDDPSRKQLWQQAQAAAEAARSSCGNAKETGALAALTLNAVRVSVQAGQYDEALAGIKALGIGNTKLYRDVIVARVAENILAAGKAEEGRKMRTALDLETFAKSLSSSDANVAKEELAGFLEWIAEDKEHWLTAVGLMSNRLSSSMLNLLPAKVLRELSASNDFTAQQKALLARTAWTRDYIRAGLPTKSTSDAMLALNPQLQQSVDKLKADYPNLKGKDLWLLTILRNPRFGIMVSSPDWTDPIEADREDFSAIDYYDHNDKNWWCPLEIDRNLVAVRNDYDSASGVLAANEYHAKDLQPLLEDGAMDGAAKSRDALLKAHPMTKAVSWKEAGQLAKARSAPNSLSRAAVALARSGRAVAAAPEALGRAVLVTRYGCNWHGRHGSYSKDAQQLLKRKFPQSEWAAKTPYWFDCMYVTWDKDYNRVTDCKPKEWAKQAPLR